MHIEDIYIRAKELHDLRCDNPIKERNQKKVFMVAISVLLDYLNSEVSVMDEEDANDAFMNLQKQVDDFIIYNP